MLDFLKPGKEKREAEASDKKEKDFVRERASFKASSEDDASYFAHKELSKDLLKWQQDLDDEIIKLRHALKGEKYNGESWIRKTMKKYNNQTRCYEEVNIPPLANDMFIDQIETQIVPFLSRSLINSNLGEKRILDILKNTMNDIADSMSDNYDRFDVEFENFDIVLRMVKNIIIPCPYKALNGWTKKIDSTMMKRIESSNDYLGERPQQKKGILGGIRS